jgi:hypothetical protein
MPPRLRVCCCCCSSRQSTIQEGVRVVRLIRLIGLVRQGCRERLGPVRARASGAASLMLPQVLGAAKGPSTAIAYVLLDPHVHCLCVCVHVCMHARPCCTCGWRRCGSDLDVTMHVGATAEHVTAHLHARGMSNTTTCTHAHTCAHAPTCDRLTRQEFGLSDVGAGPGAGPTLVAAAGRDITGTQVALALQTERCGVSHAHSGADVGEPGAPLTKLSKLSIQDVPGVRTTPRS